ncbi:Abi-alpha family protein [Cupriavidus metallidurans]|uniref:Abi-alpha family protein n=1 Tax=Cupriavidus TaxID=106589 RepID=UPI0002A378F0|nr:MULTISPECIES: Abi-alpha family protein [unclassified Cupriavidus]EKZ96481.1 hypothetical protein D769_25101 [Cupriavidus sp. HMR-1]GMG90254.1 hypothetical protein Cmtc_14740 [Cupriavidus sp. TKC]
MGVEINLVKVPEELLVKLYDDLISPSAKEVGGVISDATKTARLLLTAPLQLAAAYQDRFRRMTERIARDVPEAHRVAPPAQLVGPAIEALRFVDDSSPLWEMFEALLKSAMDERTAAKVHPAFGTLVAQLASDEAILLKRLHKSSAKVTDVLDLGSDNVFRNRRIESLDLPLDSLALPQQLDLYYAHLESLSLARWPVLKQEPLMVDGRQVGIRRHSEISLTDFGKLFVEACIRKPSEEEVR